MPPSDPIRVLCVDDEPRVLAGIGRVLRRSYEVVTAVGAEEGLTALRRDDGFAVVVSDLRMPGMDGITFLERCRSVSPDAVRVLLTGNADLESALDAVNRGAIFRFLFKPCAPDVLRAAIDAAAQQHRLVTAERIVLEQTLRGSIRALTEVLAMVNPAAFARAARARALASEIIAATGEPNGWQVEVAAMLSQIGTVTLPAETVEKLYSGRELHFAETLLVQRLPRIASELLSSIPRLEEVREILACLPLRFDGSVSPAGAPLGTSIPWGARLLKLVLDLDLLEAQGVGRRGAIAILAGRHGWYDPDLLGVLGEYCQSVEASGLPLEIELLGVRTGMRFVDDVRTSTGVLLVARGQEVSDQLVERLRNSSHMLEAKQRVRVVVPSAYDPSVVLATTR